MINMNLDQRIKLEEERVCKEYKWQLDLLDQPEYGLKNLEGFKEKGLYALKHINPQIHVTFGNLKLPETTMIVNMGTWFNCPGRKEGFCEICVECYDKHPEVMYKSRTIGRLEQEIFWRASTAEEFAKALLNQIEIKNNSTRKYKVKQIRWNEVGELRDQKDYDKLIEVTQIIGEKTGLHSYIYTHNKELDFYDKEDRPYLTVNGSNFMVDNEYRVVPKDTRHLIKEPHFNCDCDCRLCNACAKANKLIIVEELRK